MNTSFTAIADDRLIFASRAGLVRQAQRLVGPADAEDVVQDAFERALRARSLGAGRDPRPWLRRITRNVAFDRLRTRSRDASVTTDAQAVESAEGIVLRSEAGAELAGLLRALPGTWLSAVRSPCTTSKATPAPRLPRSRAFPTTPSGLACTGRARPCAPRCGRRPHDPLFSRPPRLRGSRVVHHSHCRASSRCRRRCRSRSIRKVAPPEITVTAEYNGARTPPPSRAPSRRRSKKRSTASRVCAT